MASFDFAALAKPVSPDEPCGPDLDLEGDPDFANCVARSEGIFPTSFFTRDDEGNLVPFDRTSIEFPAEFKGLDKLLETTRDLRLLTIYGRLLALNRDLDGFSACIGVVATLLRDQWEDVHPRGDEGDFTLRAAVLQGLEDSPTVIMPLQYATLAESRRAGQITYRSIMVANGEVAPRSDEASIDKATVERAFSEAELDDLKGISDQLQTIAEAVAQILATSVEKAGHEYAVDLDKLSTLIGKMRGVVDAAIAVRDPTSAQAEAGAAAAAAAAGREPAAAGTVTSAVPRGRIATHKDAEDALAAVAGYLRRSEPSNPAALLVRQAQALKGKSFADVVRLLLPSMADDARIQIGSERLFGLTFEQLAPSDGSDTETAAEDATADETEPAAEDDDASADDEAPAGEAEDGAGQSSRAPPIEATTRPDAIALLDQLVVFYRLAEPSSAIPLLAERARSMVERDFITLLKDVLPDLVPKRE